MINLSLTKKELEDLEYALEIADGNTGDDELISSIQSIMKKIEAVK